MTEFNECKTCFGYCCIGDATHYTPLTREDVTRIANYFRIPRQRFIDTYVVLTHGKIKYELSPTASAHLRFNRPCMFLRQGLCGIHSVKPEACSAAKPRPTAGDVTCKMWNQMRSGIR
jgi:Fe-S-cluster containining protein